MKILVRKSDNVVIYADADLRLTEGEAVGTNWLDQHFNLANAMLKEADLPANFIGGVWSYVAGNWTIVDQDRYNDFINEKASQAGTPYQYFIDIGPFFDRLGAYKFAVLMSPDATVQAILRDVQVRKWIDLKKPEVTQSLAYIGTKISGVTAELQASVVNAPVLPEENMALRKMYFS